MVRGGEHNVVLDERGFRAYCVEVDWGLNFLSVHLLPLGDNEKPMSGLDGLVIAMRRTLKKKHLRVWIVTDEKRMARVCQSDPGVFPPAICIIRD